MGFFIWDSLWCWDSFWCRFHRWDFTVPELNIVPAGRQTTCGDVFCRFFVGPHACVKRGTLIGNSLAYESSICMLKPTLESKFMQACTKQHVGEWHDKEAEGGIVLMWESRCKRPWRSQGGLLVVGSRFHRGGHPWSFQLGAFRLCAYLLLCRPHCSITRAITNTPAWT